MNRPAVFVLALGLFAAGFFATRHLSRAETRVVFADGRSAHPAGQGEDSPSSSQRSAKRATKIAAPTMHVRTVRRGPSEQDEAAAAEPMRVNTMRNAIGREMIASAIELKACVLQTELPSIDAVVRFDVNTTALSMQAHNPRLQSGPEELYPCLLEALETSYQGEATEDMPFLENYQGELDIHLTVRRPAASADTTDGA